MGGTSLHNIRYGIRTRAWCPNCYEEWRNSKQVVYEPLIWSLEVVHTCPKHHQKLHLCCPYADCRHVQFHFTSRYLSGYCSWCHRWLGSYRYSNAEYPAILGIEENYQEWVYKRIGEMLSAAPNLPAPPLKSNIAVVFGECINRLTGGNLRAFARQIQVTSKSTRNWKWGQQIPTMENLLNICYRCGISPLSFILGDKENIKYSFIDSTSRDAATNTLRKKHRKFNVDHIRSVLLSILQNPEDPPPSMKEVARGLGCSHSQVRGTFPDLCKAISARYLSFLSQKRLASIQKDCAEVRQVMLKLHAQERYPSLRQVQKNVKNPAIFKDPNIHNAWKEILKELGWT
jgi:TniQ